MKDWLYAHDVLKAHPPSSPSPPISCIGIKISVVYTLTVENYESRWPQLIE